jgi:hypothetical protein
VSYTASIINWEYCSLLGGVPFLDAGVVVISDFLTGPFKRGRVRITKNHSRAVARKAGLLLR